MFLERIFGMVAAAAFVLGSIGHIELLASREFELFRSPLAPAFLLYMAAFLYVFALAGKRSDLQYENGELLILPMVATLPAWAKVLSAILLTYGSGLCIFSLLANGTLELLPSGQHALRDDNGALRTISLIEYRYRTNAIILSVDAVFTAFSFVIATYCLVRRQTRTD